LTLDPDKIDFTCEEALNLIPSVLHQRDHLMQFNPSELVTEGKSIIS
jgi:hypothetical protein